MITAALLASSLTFAPASVQAQQSSTKKAAEDNPRLASIRRVFGQGEAEDGFFRVNMPRSDLHVRIGNDALSPRFEFTSYIGFVPIGTNNVMAISEVIVLQSEVPAVLTEASRQGLRVTALHNQMLDDGPPHYWVHWYSTGDGPTLARGVEAALAHMNSARQAASGQ